MKKLLFITLIIGILSVLIHAQSEVITVFESVKIKNNKRAEALFYYENNWRQLRLKALKKHYINLFEIFESKADKKADFDIVLITRYSSKEQFDKSEEHFQKLIKESGGLKLLNNLKPSEFRENVFVKVGKSKSTTKSVEITFSKNYQFINGKWFNGKKFQKQTFYSINGFLTKKKPKQIDETIDLQNKFVIPPLADSHTHSFDSPYLISKQIQDNLRDGVFYAKVLNNVRSSAITIKDKVNKPESIDVQYSHGGLTSSFSHPIEVYESLGLGFYSYEQQTANAEKIWQSRKRENDAYYIIDNAEDLENKWQTILDGKPNHIKIFLRNSEVYEKRRGFIPKEWHRSDGGIDPKLVPLVVKKANEAGLRVSVSANSVEDYQVAVAAGANEVSHLPCYQLIDEGENCELFQR